MSQTEHKTDLLGTRVPDWQPRANPTAAELVGQFCYLRVLDPARDAADLFAAFQRDQEQVNWHYLPYGPFDTYATFVAWLEHDCQASEPRFYTIFNDAQQPVGMASYLRITPAMGSIEVGHIHFSPLLQRTTAATEAMYLMMQYIFDRLGYRRYEWKCNHLNGKSKQAAVRLGFQFEGVFRQAAVYKGRNRDTAWFSIIDREWPALKNRFEKYLHPNNFDENGRQKQPL